MCYEKPFYRTCLPFVNSDNLDFGKFEGNHNYVRDRKYASDGQHYINAFLIIQRDFKELLEYIEPDTKNFNCYSHRISQLLFRICVEIEANCTAILKENGYSGKPKDWTMKDYKKIEESHCLSYYKAAVPNWKISVRNCNSEYCRERKPFENWASNGSLLWYQAYNAVKHDRHNNFSSQATFKNLVDAMCGLFIIMSAQFYTRVDLTSKTSDAEYQDNIKFGNESKFSVGIGDYFEIGFPDNIPGNKCYNFKWDEIQNASNNGDTGNDRFNKYPYN